ncbi:VTT domain-containing protein [Streptomyces ochraceiscleroticus]|uniref:VTT domain-containing protein n=1 Tax=Streptomyces ochraceiscleroticus TaxID=47761 RepID=UPI0006916C65|nr:VTT domain-containing protein [Streptomyces ochraceiscleroticus]
MNTLALGPQWLDPDYLISTFGLIGVLVIVFAESGLLIGFFLPGDSLLFTTGLLVTAGKLDKPLWLVCLLVVLAAVLGDQAGYLFGRKVGPSLFKRPDSKLFKQENVEKAHEFFEKHGPKSLILARFVPIVRTFTPIIAGVSRMNYRSFLIFNVVGGALWGAGVTLLGAALGGIEFVHKNIEAILVLIVLISVVPIVIEYLRGRKKNKKAAAEGAADAAGQDAPPQAGPAAGGHADATQPMPRVPYEGEERAPYGGGRGGHEPAPYGAQQDRPQYGRQQPEQQSPYGHQQPPYGRGQAPYGEEQAPYGQGQASPYGRQDQAAYGGQQDLYGGQQASSYGEQQAPRAQQSPYGRQDAPQPPQAPYGQQPQQPQQPPYGGQSGPAPYGRPAQQPGGPEQYHSEPRHPQQGPQQPHPQDHQQPPGEGRRGRHAKR